MKTKTLRWLAAMLLLVSAMVIPARGNAQVTLKFIEGSKNVSEGPTETADKLFDGKTDTKFCGPCNEQSPAYVIFQASKPCWLNGYTITTANDTKDYSGRNPKDWNIYGSNDRNTWTKLVTVSNDDKLQGENYTPYEYTLATAIADPYIYYKWEITATHDDINVQASEFSISALVQCTYHGGVGDGWTGTGGSVFTTGYTLSLWLNAAKDAVVVRAEFLDTDKTATVAYMQNYSHSGINFLEEIALNRDGNTFSNEIPFSFFSNNEGKVIRFVVKFEFDGGLRVTTPEYFYLDGLGCEDFTIYHHDDLPAEPEDGAVTTFEGGRILRPIQYKRKLTPGKWETLCLPFTVDSITVYDPDDKKNYKLYAQYRNGGNVYEGEFWLRKFVDSEVTAGAAFQNNWQDIEANSQGEALPKMGVPYIIRVPEGTYYDDKYIVFHGAGNQTIAATNEAPIVPADGYFSYSGNQTMKDWNLQSAYVLNVEREAFEAADANGSVIVHPFECAVNATQETISRSPRLMISSPQITTADGLPSTEYEGGRIYTTMGVLVGTFETLDEEENCVMHLPEGIYIVQRRQAISKIHISK